MNLLTEFESIILPEGKTWADIVSSDPLTTRPLIEYLVSEANFIPRESRCIGCLGRCYLEVSTGRYRCEVRACLSRSKQWTKSTWFFQPPRGITHSKIAAIMAYCAIGLTNGVQWIAERFNVSQPLVERFADNCRSALLYWTMVRAPIDDATRRQVLNNELSLSTVFQSRHSPEIRIKAFFQLCRLYFAQNHPGFAVNGESEWRE